MLYLRKALACLILCVLASGIPMTANGASTDEERAHVVATRFLADYFSKGYTAYFLESPLVTPAAKSSLRRIEAAARKKDPKAGLDHDPVAQGQEHATAYDIENLVVTGDKATAEGVAAGVPRIPLRLVRSKGGWLIDGAGEINPGPKAPVRR